MLTRCAESKDGGARRNFSTSAGPLLLPDYLSHSLYRSLFDLENKLTVNDNTVNDINAINASHPSISRLYFMHQPKLANTAKWVYHNNASFPVKQNHISDPLHLFQIGSPITNTTTLRHRTHLMPRKPFPRMMRMEPMVAIDAEHYKPPHQFRLRWPPSRRICRHTSLGHRVRRS